MVWGWIQGLFGGGHDDEKKKASKKKRAPKKVTPKKAGKTTPKRKMSTAKKASAKKSAVKKSPMKSRGTKMPAHYYKAGKLPTIKGSELEDSQWDLMFERLEDHDEQKGTLNRFPGDCQDQKLVKWALEQIDLYQKTRTSDVALMDLHKICRLHNQGLLDLEPAVMPTRISQNLQETIELATANQGKFDLGDHSFVQGLRNRYIRSVQGQTTRPPSLFQLERLEQAGFLWREPTPEEIATPKRRKKLPKK